jgi:hypothetical protein
VRPLTEQEKEQIALTVVRHVHEQIDGLRVAALDIARSAVNNALATVEAAAQSPEPINRGKLYVAGPMRGLPQLNFPAFYLAEGVFRSMGYEVLNPARMDDEKQVTTKDDVPEKGGPAGNEAWREMVRRDLDAVLVADAIALLKGWDRGSRGATAEAAVARWLNLPAYIEQPDGRWFHHVGGSW